MTQEVVEAFREYKEALDRMDAQLILVNYHLTECAEHTKRTADYTNLVVWYVRGYLNKL